MLLTTDKLPHNMKKSNFHTDFLTPNTGFWVGAGSAFNLAGNYYDFAVSKSENEADRKAMSSDWGMVGQDIKTVSQIEDTNALVNSDSELCEL